MQDEEVPGAVAGTKPEIARDTDGVTPLPVNGEGLGVGSEAQSLEIHPLASLFPPMNEKEFEALVADFQEHGQREPIWTHQGKVIDGRHRLRACQRLGLEPRTQEWDGSGSLLEFVISLNLRRRHLKERQRAMIAARLKPAFEEDARSRMEWAAKELTPTANWQQGSSCTHAGKLLNVSERSVARACKVLEKGIPELIAAVDACKLAVSTAAALADLPQEEQARVLAAGRVEISKALPKRNKAAAPEVSNNAQATAPPVLPPATEDEKLLMQSFSGGLAKLIRNEHGLCIEFTNNFLDELCIAVRNREHFTKLVEHGVMLVRKKK